MPRAAPVAIGVVGGALLASTETLSGIPVAATLLALAGLLVGWWATLGTRPRPAEESARRPAEGPLVALGLVAIALRLALASTATVPASPTLPTGSRTWSGVVESVGTPSDGRQRAVLRLALDETGGSSGTAEGSSRLRVAATLPRYPILAPGDRVRVTGSVRAPGEDGYGSYLRRTGIAGSLFSRTLETGPGGGPDPLVALEGLRRTVDRGLALVLPEPEAGLAGGILVGLRDRVDPELAADFTTAGVSHVVAISGWNIAIVGATVAALARRRSRGK